MIMQRQTPQVVDVDLKKIEKIMQCTRTRPLRKEEGEVLQSAFDIYVQLMDAAKDESITVDELRERFLPSQG